MEINITELREQKRPLWMTSLGVEAYADLLGGGGDLYADRLSADWARDFGEEVVVDEQLETLLEGRYVGEDYLS